MARAGTKRGTKRGVLEAGSSRSPAQVRPGPQSRPVSAAVSLHRVALSPFLLGNNHRFEEAAELADTTDSSRVPSLVPPPPSPPPTPPSSGSRQSVLHPWNVATLRASRKESQRFTSSPSAMPSRSTGGVVCVRSPPLYCHAVRSLSVCLCHWKQEFCRQ